MRVIASVDRTFVLTDSVTVVTRLRLHPGQLVRFVALVDALPERDAAGQNNRRLLRLFESRLEPNLLLVVAEWQERQAYLQYISHIAADLDTITTTPPERRLYRRLHRF